jgi:hypothetical protein
MATMPYANHQGVQIHSHVEGQGIPLVRQHGFADSLESWYAWGDVPALRED